MLFILLFPSSAAPKSPPEKTRYDTSLGLLTKKFVELLGQSSDGVLDLNLAAETLQVHFNGKQARKRNIRESRWKMEAEVSNLTKSCLTSCLGAEKATLWHYQRARRHPPHQEEIQKQHPVDVSGPSLTPSGLSCVGWTWFFPMRHKKRIPEQNF